MNGSVSINDAEIQLRATQIDAVAELAQLDVFRENRTGIPEVVFAEGKTPEATEHQMHTVDLPNARRVAPSAAHAQLLVHKADVRRIERIEWVASLQS